MTADAKAALGHLRDAAADGSLDDVCARHGLRILAAFGSATREGPAADLDLAFAFEPSHTGDVLVLLADLVELTGTGAIDLMDLERAEPVARERALVGGVPLYESEPGVFARAQMAAMLERMDTAWLRRLDLEAMGR